MQNPVSEDDLTRLRAPVAPDDASTIDRDAHDPSLSTEPALGSLGRPAALPSIPGYDVQSEIARGGMGRVLAARELALDREVAIKILLPGADAERFVTESKITAKLPHPSIPPVYALGAMDDGTPFLAMKFVRGRTFSDDLKSRPAAGGMARWLQVFEQICQAVGFAHARGIIHRDLKPANVMLGEFGEVQVMDWGLARDLLRTESAIGDTEEFETEGNSQLTRAGAIMGTPAYMAPEQARGEIVGPRADVFSLGAILCQVLTGQSPYGPGSSAEVLARAARAQLDTAREELARCGADSELIALARLCLAADTEDRPANGLAVAGLVAAHRAGVEDRLRKSETERAASAAKEIELKKRRRVMAWAGGIIAGVLLAGTGISLWQAGAARAAAKSEAVQKGIADDKALLAEQQEGIAKLKAIEATNQAARAEKEKQNAQAQARRAETVVGLTTGLFQSSDPSGLTGIGLLPPSQRSRQLTAADLLRIGSATLGDKLKDDPLTRAALLAVLGDVNRGLGNKNQAREFLEEALKLREARLPDDHEDVAASRFHLANWHMEQGDPIVALRLYERVLAWHTAKQTLDTAGGADFLTRYSVMLMTIGDPSAESYARRGLAVREKLHGKDHRDTIIAQLVVATSLFDQMRSAEALPLLAKAFESLSRLPGAADDTALQAVVSFQRAMLTSVLGLALAEPGLRKSLESLREVFGPDHTYVALVEFDYATLLNELNRLEECEVHFKESLRIVRGNVGIGHPRALKLVTGYAEFLILQKRTAEAAKIVDEAHREAHKRYPNEFLWRFQVECLQGKFAGMLKNTDVALKAADAAYALALTVRRPFTDTEQNAIVGLANGIGDLKDIADIKRVFAQFDALVKEKLNKIEQDRHYTNYGCILAERSLFTEALPILRDVLGPDERSGNKDESKALGYSCWQLAKCYWHTGDFANAEKLFRRASKLLGRDANTQSLNFQKDLLNFTLLHTRAADTPALIEKYKKRKDLSALNLSWSYCVESLSAKPGQAFDLTEVERRFGTSTERDVAMYRAYAVIAAGGDVRREHKRLSDMIRNGQEVTTVVEVYSCCNVIMGNYEKALGNFKLYKLDPQVGFRHYKHRLLTAFCAERNLSTEETRKALQEARDAAEQELKAGAQMKDVAIGGYALNEALLLRFWLRHIQLALEPKPRETIPPPRPLK